MVINLIVAYSKHCFFFRKMQVTARKMTHLSHQTEAKSLRLTILILIFSLLWTSTYSTLLQVLQQKLQQKESQDVCW